MARVPSLSHEVAESLRQKHYNAQLVARRNVHAQLAILRVQPDEGMPPFEAGQYTTLGLGLWERRVEGFDNELLDEKALPRVLKRAYSASCSVFTPDGHVAPAQQFPYIEFYLTLVHHTVPHLPGLTPRLFALEPGERLLMGQHFKGQYTLAEVKPNDTVVFAATGTGEAPHNAMIAELLASAHAGRIVTVTGVRYKQDLGYIDVHRRLESLYSNYRYIALTTREPENIDAAHPAFVGKGYLQNYFASGDFERETGIALDPRTTRVFLCGNPAMIGMPTLDAHGGFLYPEPVGLIEVLAHRGFKPHEFGRPGNIHFERYW